MLGLSKLEVKYYGLGTVIIYLKTILDYKYYFRRAAKPQMRHPRNPAEFHDLRILLSLSLFTLLKFKTGATNRNVGS